MMDRTDRHCRFLFRQLTRRALLYTEMITTGALLHGHRVDLLKFSPQEQPLALQLGGSQPDELARAAELAQQKGFAEVNLNAGCPSSRVKSGGIGAVLMADPSGTAKCIRAMCAATDLPVTLKHRTGIRSRFYGDLTGYARLKHFVETVADAGCRSFTVHARIALLEGLSPAENRSIPPLDYAMVYRLKQDFPDLEIVLNGGVDTVDQALLHLKQVDGVMTGRAAYRSPMLLARVDRHIFGDTRYPVPQSPEEVVRAMQGYIRTEIERGVRSHHITRHMYGLYHGRPGARRFRSLLQQQVPLRQILQQQNLPVVPAPGNDKIPVITAGE